MEHWGQTSVETFPCQNRGDHRRTAVVFGPVAPSWTGSEFCSPLVRALTANGYDVHVVDSIPMLLAHKDACVYSLLGYYMEFLTRKFGVPDIIAGYALGGTLATQLAPLFPNSPDVICISGPGVPDASLKRRLGDLNTALKAGRLIDALELLSHSVTAIGSSPSELHVDRFDGADEPLAIERMIAGFEFLLKLDVREGLRTFEGRLIAMTGELSKLATRETLGFEPGAFSRFYHSEIPNAGMRVLLEAPDMCLQILNNWIHHDQENSNFAR